MRELRLIRTVAVLSMLALTFFASTSSAALRERTVHFWASTYGDGVPAYSPDYDCRCAVGPCPPVYEIVGERTVYCDGTTYEWGYVDHLCADRTFTAGPFCPQ